MKNLWQRVKNLWQGLWQTQSDSQSKERNYLKEIEQAIESFRLMSMEEQRKFFVVSSMFIENNLVEGNFDNKVHIKSLMRFVKIIKKNIFLPKLEPANFEKLNFIYIPIYLEIEGFINELYGVEKIKENRFLNILNNEDRVSINVALKRAIVQFVAIANQVNNTMPTLEGREDFAANVKSLFTLEKNKIKKIIGEAMCKIAEQDKINKLKISSEVFKKKAKEYRNNSKRFLVSAVVLIVGTFLFVFYQVKPSAISDTGSGSFYTYLILENLLRGRLLLSIIVLTGFFYCLRFYAASNHNAIVCDQRANTLESFEALYENVEEDKEKLLVVEKVLNSATEHLPTGFSKLQSDSSGGIVSSLASLLKR